jgi:hypothetical protein
VQLRISNPVAVADAVATEKNSNDMYDKLSKFVVYMIIDML